jgi:hypothetical protein
MGCNNLDVLEGVQRDKVGVTGDDMRSLSADGQLQKLVVLRVSANGYGYHWFDPLGLSCQSGDESPNIFLIQISPESFATQHLIPFREDCRGQQDLSLSKFKIEGLTGLRIGQQQGTYEYVRIEHAPQLCALQQRV